MEMNKMTKDDQEDNGELSLEKLITLFPHLENELMQHSKLPLFFECMNLPKFTERTRLKEACLRESIIQKDKNKEIYLRNLDCLSYEFTWTPRRGVVIVGEESNQHYRSQFGMLEIDIIDVEGKINLANGRLLDRLRDLREIMNQSKHRYLHPKMSQDILPEDIDVIPCYYLVNWIHDFDGIYTKMIDVLQQFNPALKYFVQKRVTSTVTNIQVGVHSVQSIEHSYKIDIYDVEKFLIAHSKSNRT